MPSLAGNKIDKYTIIEQVGQGGMAVVYRAHDTVLEREVAVKVLHAHLAGREESRARLQREALAVAKLRHDNILEIFDYSGTDTAESYIVTEFIRGPTMRQWVDEQLDPRPTIAAMIVHRLCNALCEAHRLGIVHRDIKPENVMVRKRDGALKLMDFGIAQIVDDQKLTLTGQLIGSPAYMAPELISGQPLDRRTDLFSLGILLYQLATGKLPFEGRNPHEVLNRIADGDYPPAASVCPLVDNCLERIIAVALATVPEKRFQTAEAFAEELEQYLDEMGIQPTQDELRSYFDNPTRYISELDIRVCDTLVQHAHAGARAGQTAKAIALLGRVLEIDSGHADAQALLSSMRRQAQRTRALLLVGAATVVAGMVGAGVTLSRRPQAADQLPPDEPALRAPNVAGLSSRPIASDTPDSAANPPATTSELPDVAALSPARQTRKPAPQPLRTRPRRANPEPPVVPPAAAEFACEVKLSNIPFNAARNHKLQVGKAVHNVPGTRVRLELSETSTASLTRGMWRGSVRLTPRDCKNGPVELVAQPKDAVVRVVGALAGTTVRCISGCPSRQLGRNQTAANDLAPIPIKQGSSQPVQLVFKAPNHQDRTLRTTVHPGPQTVSGKLKPRE